MVVVAPAVVLCVFFVKRGTNILDFGIYYDEAHNMNSLDGIFTQSYHVTEPWFEARQ